MGFSAYYVTCAVSHILLQRILAVILDWDTECLLENRDIIYKIPQIQHSFSNVCNLFWFLPTYCLEI
jgi:hypothetical protein